MRNIITGLAAATAIVGLTGCTTYDANVSAPTATSGAERVMPVEVLAAAESTPITQFIAGQPDVAAIVWIPLIPDHGSVEKLTFGQPTAVVMKEKLGGRPGSGGTIKTDANGNIDLTDLKVNGDIMIIATLPVVTYQGVTSFPWSFYQGPQGGDPYQALGIATCAKTGCDPNLKPEFGAGAFPDEFAKPIILSGVGLDAIIFIDIDDKDLPYYYQFQVVDSYTPGVTQILDPEVKNRGGSQ
ncbi:MAG: hypothetical protein KDA46_12895 [Parvularculaceae bacterium]|nr:hypothetical protein [Parvularculaceae bacterium]